MNPILQKLYRNDTTTAIEDILTKYARQWFAVVNFLYFANAMKYHLFENLQQQIDFDYSDALLQSDFLLPDGIALQIWDKFENKKEPKTHNLNGTDLTPAFLHHVVQNYDIELYIVSVYDEKIGKWPERLEKWVEKIRETYGIQRIYSYQTPYSHRWEDYPFTRRAQAPKADTTVRVLLHCTGTPFQEIWTTKNLAWFKEKNILVMNVGGFIDFASWFEKRAPKWMVKGRVFETFYRLFTNPKKNIKKFLVMFGAFRVMGKKILSKLKKMKKKILG